ncbi:MAG: bacillithiol biosynthesis cysteine-adding enzyme BshC [Candidatus Heimdallarchaeota archaeon]
MAEEVKLDLLDLEVMYPNSMLLDYINRKEPMSKFFGGVYDKMHPIKFRGDRGVLKDILMKFNKSIDAQSNVFENIESVENENVKFVITGQQPGLFTGPMYTIYKTFSAINYAKKYSTDEVKLIPLFWNASEDHDVEEVDNIRVLNKKNDVEHLKFDSRALLGKSLENVQIDHNQFESLLHKMKSSLVETEFTDSVFNKLSSILKKSEKWGEFFSRTLSFLMGEWGLVLLEPKILRSHLKDYFTTVLSDPVKFNTIFQKTTNSLTGQGYKPKMHKKENIAGLFYIDEKLNRLTITLKEKGMYELSDGKTFTREEILNEVQAHPEQFSTNAIFRPLAQDLMIPTHVFVGGPSEIGYHIQIKDLYKEFNLTQPNVVFRMGATVIERHINKIIEKYKFSITELRDLNRLSSKLIASENEQKLQGYFNNISETLDNMNTELNDYNKELGSRVLHRKKSIMKELENIEKMYIKYVKNDNQLMMNQLTKTRAYLFPSDIPQERMFNIFQYLNKYSLTLLDCMRNLLSKDQPGKHVVLKCWMF